MWICRKYTCEIFECNTCDERQKRQANLADHLKSDNIVGINIGYENGQKYLLRGRLMVIDYCRNHYN